MAVFTAAAAIGSAVLGTVSGLAPAVAAFKFGAFLTTAVGFLTQAAVGLALNALAPKPSSESKAGIGGFRLNGKRSNLDRQVIYGQTRVGGAIVFDSNSNDIVNSTLYRVIVHTGHPIEGYEEVYIDGEKITSWKVMGTGQVITKPSEVPNGTSLTPNGSRYESNFFSSFSGSIVMRFFDGTQTTADASLVSYGVGWTNNHVLNNCAYISCDIFHGLGDDFPNGVPEILCTIKGKKLYDPRTDTTAWSDNPALCLRDYIASDYGLNEEAANIDDTLVAAAANVCDETNTVSGAKRYTCNGAFTTAVTPIDLLSEMLTSMGGLLWYAQGKWRMKPAYYVAPTVSFTEDDLRSSVAVKTRHSRRDNFNIVKGTFKGPESAYEFTDYPELRNQDFLDADNGVESVVDLNLPFTDTADEARRIARIFLERNRQQLTISASFGMKAFQVQVGDIIQLSVDRFGWVQKEFEVASWTFGLTDAQDLQVQMTLREISESVFDEVDDGAVYERDNTNLPSPFLTEAPKNLTVSDGGFTTEDGTFVNSFIVDWDEPDAQFVNSYVIEWRRQGESKYNSVSLRSTEYQIAPVVENVVYDIRVKAINTFGVSGPYVSATAQVGGDTIAPNSPTNLSASGGLGFIEVKWTNPANADFNYVKVFESDDNVVGNATEIGSSSGNSFVRANLGPLVTKYYWVSAVDYSGNESGKTGPVNATTSTITTADLGPAIIEYDNFAQDVIDVFDGINTDISQKVDIADYNITVDYQQQLEDATTQLATDSLQLALNASALEGRINDAGITVDPDTGSVTIQGLSALDNRVNNVEIDLDAVESQLTLTATTAYVDSEIAAAQLPEATITELENTVARVDTAEIDIDALEGAITLTSTGSLYDVNDGTLGVEALEGRITVAEGEIDLKASQTALNDVDTRLNTAEIQLDSIDAPTINIAVQDVRRLSNKTDDLGELTLQEALGRYNDRKYITQDVAYARQSFTADVNDQKEALAQVRTELAAQINANEASIVSEQTTRANADSALASDITTLQASLTDLETDTSANSSAVSSLDARVTSAEGNISSNSSSITALQSDLTTAEGNISGNATAISGLDTRVTSAEGQISAQASQINSLSSDLTTAESNISGNATAISGLNTRVTDNEGDISAQASQISSLSTTVGNNTTTISQVSQSVDGIEGRYGVQIDNNGNISGYQLLSGAGGSAFNVRADQFAVFDSNNNGGDYPFTVFTSSRNIDGVVYPAGTYIRNAFIDEAAIVDLSVDTIKVKNNAITTAAYGSYNGFNRFWSGSFSGPFNDNYSTISFAADNGDLLLLEATYVVQTGTSSGYPMAGSATLQPQLLYNGSVVETAPSLTLTSSYTPLRLSTLVMRQSVSASYTGTHTVILRGVGTNLSGSGSYSMRSITLSAFTRRK